VKYLPINDNDDDDDLMNADINECAVNKGNCSVNATCNNTPCSYSCSCFTGFQGDGFTCTGEL